jgi:adhesin transport system outer membrane protein
MRYAVILGMLLSGASLISSAQAMPLNQAVQIAMESNPEIGQAIQNHDATGFELRQALGLYAPRVDLDASVGVQLLDSPGRRATGVGDDALYPAQIGVTATYDLFDGGFRDAEVARQAARVDGASYRVLERSEFIALQIARVYYQVLLQHQILELTRQNVAFHEAMVSDVAASIESGQLTEADRFQAIERMAAARARLTEAAVELEAANIEFRTYVGMAPTSIALPPRPGSALPTTLEMAIATGILSNPRMLTAGADIDAASALVDQAESAFYPKLQLEGRAATGYDLSGANGLTNDLSARITLRWNIYDGGIKAAEVQEELRRESEAMMVFDQAAREVEQAVRESWLRLQSQGELARVYDDQLRSSKELIESYREQFKIGDRSLLDVLDAQNTRVNVQVLQQTALYSVMFAEYRLLAASGNLLAFMNVTAPKEAVSDTRAATQVSPWEIAAPSLLTPLHLPGM